MEIPELIANIKDMRARNAFRNYIEYIQFPYFRNIEKNIRVTFDFPLTVFVGQNGSGKSSTLHALYGAPKKNTPYEFWFSTAVDPIAEALSDDDRHGFFYMYKDLRGNEKEVAKVRIFKRNNPDYWETSRPLERYGMRRLEGGARNAPLEKKVVYIDFRAELSAFDKYFYFKNPKKNSKSNNKQEYIRKKAKTLKNILDGKKGVIRIAHSPQNQIPETLSADELRWLSFILGKQYVSGKVIRHKLFEEWGTSVLFTTNFFTYSEAFAGSGEMAAVKLVREVLNAGRFSLILLDEPEVSLHPGAQKRLKHFLLEQVRRRQLQVIISTHSPSIIEDLPSNAIKVFSQLPNGRFSIKNEITPDEAFFHLEQTNPAKKTIIVEDRLAKELVVSVLNSVGADTAALFDTTSYTGGHTVLKQNFITVYSRERIWNKFILFDGDQRKDHFDPDQILEAQQTNQRFRDEIVTQTGSDITFHPDGNQTDGAREDQEKELRKTYLKFYLQNVFYLPLNKPEDIIWNQELAESLLVPLQKSEAIDIMRRPGIDSKEKFKIMSEAMTGSTAGIEILEKTFLNHWLEQKNDEYLQVVAILNQIRDLSL